MTVSPNQIIIIIIIIIRAASLNVVSSTVPNSQVGFHTFEVKRLLLLLLLLLE